MPLIVRFFVPMNAWAPLLRCRLVFSVSGPPVVLLKAAAPTFSVVLAPSASALPMLSNPAVTDVVPE